jgi:dTDP-4-amino-4,6-dideoxygalactose transaminase
MILMNDFLSLPESHRLEQAAAVTRVLNSGWYILGKEDQQFESAWATRCNAKEAIGVGNGMDAIEIGFRTLNIGEGDEIITTPMTAYASVLAILRVGAIPVFADIDEETSLLSKESVERCISPRTKGVLLVHLYGQVRNMAEWVSFCKSKNIYLLEDCAQSHLASENGQVAGTFGQWGAYSFYPTKNLGALGDGGALITNSTEIAAQARMLRNYGQSQRYHHPLKGLNSRLDEMQAAILSVRLKWLDEFTSRRREIARLYRAGIKNSKIRFMAAPKQEENHVYHLFVIRLNERDRLSQFLRDREIENLIHYPIPVHQQKPCEKSRRDPNGLKNAEHHAETCLSIPCHPQMSDSSVAQVIQAINEFK